ncbi:MAG: butanol dehydrogenase [Candidatus Sedimenticola endophacoides]|nr:MAG: butanol dehydrogenase [Candidatus Sedimenticola endophacoides]OQX33036.1 MAG: butanol dehydrogenase [Candidatus Sedimenticola endophacoides]OQX38647.1 MAG: butanol dehydrogenase [Candidatus Sedimenticola endophacoides]OQX41450.1 MAG: butanol dehydrogenase [Candidatus Sedimenticola endophacoides]OQX43989.1 MAG: butanol dehydrogenase [Candidatus Sedimenticola endophacoides]
MNNGAKSKVIKILMVGIILGIILWGGFNTAMEATNSETFCISCHEMETTVYQELKETVHFTNRTGVRATCPDCHVPREWIHKVVRKIQATNELYHKMLGTVDTPEKFEEKRLELAQNVWRAMKKTNSRECRNCHKFESMNLDKQDSRSADAHDPHYWDAVDGKPLQKTCIDCHKGIAHSLPAGYDPAADEMNEG